MNEKDKGPFFVKITVALALYSLLLPSIQAAESVYKGPIMPPPMLEPCPPIPPPNVDIELNRSIDACLSFKEIHKKYLQQEESGKSYIQNRNVKYFEIFDRFMFEYKGGFNRDAEDPYPFNLSEVIDYFGFPDYVNITDTDNQKTERYAYLFNYKANKDYAIILIIKNNKINSIGYNETRHLITKEWEEY